MVASPQGKKPSAATSKPGPVKWAAPAILAIYPLSQACAYAVSHQLIPAWGYIWPALYSLLVMALLLASFVRQTDTASHHPACHQRSDSSGRWLLTILTILLVIFSALVPMLRDIKLPDADMMRNLHYAISLCDAIFAFLVLTAVIDLVSGVFFDPDDSTMEEEARRCALRDGAVRRGYVTAVLGMGVLYLVSQYQPQWSNRLILPIVALSVAIPALHILQRSRHHNDRG